LPSINGFTEARLPVASNVCMSSRWRAIAATTVQRVCALFQHSAPTYLDIVDLASLASQQRFVEASFGAPSAVDDAALAAPWCALSRWPMARAPGSPVQRCAAVDRLVRDLRRRRLSVPPPVALSLFRALRRQPSRSSGARHLHRVAPALLTCRQVPPPGRPHRCSWSPRPTFTSWTRCSDVRLACILPVHTHTTVAHVP
jgi:hypothetical protein